ncbi:MAG: hypothetical protein QXR58_02880 [Candidatus Micrarchaeaceae archaeon]
MLAFIPSPSQGDFPLAGLKGRTVVAAMNFAPKQVANFLSEVLVLGAITAKGIKLLDVDKNVSLGTKVT